MEAIDIGTMPTNKDEQVEWFLNKVLMVLNAEQQENLLKVLSKRIQLRNSVLVIGQGPLHEAIVCTLQASREAGIPAITSNNITQGMKEYMQPMVDEFKKVMIQQIPRDKIGSPTSPIPTHDVRVLKPPVTREQRRADERKAKKKNIN